MMKKMHPVAVAIVLLSAVWLLMAGPVMAGTDDLAKEADKLVRNAERQMHSGKNSEADMLLQKAAALIDQGKSEAPDNNKINQVEKKYDRIRQMLDKKLGNTAGKSGTSAPKLPPKPQPKAMSKQGSTASGTAAASAAQKLPAGVTKRLKDISRYLDKAERVVGKYPDQAQYELKQAAGLFKEIDASYSGQFDPGTGEFADVKGRYTDLLSKADQAVSNKEQAKADREKNKKAMEEQSAEWVARFQEYLSYPGQQGHNPDKLVFVPGTSEPEKFDKAKANFKAFEAFYETYKKTEFPYGKSDQLADLADRQAPVRIKDFEEGFGSRVASVSGDAEKEIDSAMAYLVNDNGWKSDEKAKPVIVDFRRMTSIRDMVTNLSTALGPDDPESVRIQKKFDTLAARDRENREIRKNRTFMTPDRYQGKEIKELKKKAESLVRENKKEGGKPIRCTIISPNWQEQTVQEWTDTSKTQWRVRTTRSLTAQVAAETKDGYRLITVALAKDKQSDGSWGPLYGNLHQFSEPMLKKNIDK